MGGRSMLDEIHDLVRVILLNQDRLFVKTSVGSHLAYDGGSAVAEKLYCPPCGDVRRVNLTAEPFPFKGRTNGLMPRKSSPPQPRHIFPDDATYEEYRGRELEAEIGNAVPQLVPSVLTLACVQCETKFTSVIYAGPDGPALVILPSCKGGLTTPHTPEAVAYYLDQAHRAKALGANTAAVAMFRAALESLLQERGFTARMLGPKLGDLESAILAGTAPKWAKELDTDFLTIIKDFGNASVHTSDSDISKQGELDGRLVAEVGETFQMLLYLVYEIPHKKAERLNALKAKVQALKK